MCAFCRWIISYTYTSTHKVADLRRPDRRTAMKVLVDKTYNFVDVLWDAYIDHNVTDLRLLHTLYMYNVLYTVFQYAT